MGLFVNEKKHPNVFKNKVDVFEPNQTFFKKDPFDEMFKEQQTENESLQRSLYELKASFEQKEKIQENRMQEISHHLAEVNERNLEYEDHESRIVERLVKHELQNEELTQKFGQQLDFQKQVVNQIYDQQKKNEEIINRMEIQEALLEKVVRQIDYFRSILYERSYYLAGKIENGYTQTTSYITKLMTAPNHSITQFKINGKQKEDSK